MSENVKTFIGCFFNNQIGQRRVARIVVGEILNHVRRFVTGVVADVPLIGVDVKSEVRKPMGIENKKRIGAALVRSPADFLQRFDWQLPPAFEYAFALRQQQRGDMRYFGREYNLAHGVPGNRDPLRRLRRPRLALGRK